MPTPSRLLFTALTSIWLLAAPVPGGADLDRDVVDLSTPKDTVRLKARDRLMLEAARSLARRRLLGDASCRQLFEDLEHDGATLLAQAEFFLAEADLHRDLCGSGGAAMFTVLGGSQIGLCPDSFRRQTRHELAARLLHEILHHAGLSEKPHDPDGLTPRQITQWVRNECRL